MHHQDISNTFRPIRHAMQTQPQRLTISSETKHGRIHRTKQLTHDLALTLDRYAHYISLQIAKPQHGRNSPGITSITAILRPLYPLRISGVAQNAHSHVHKYSRWLKNTLLTLRESTTQLISSKLGKHAYATDFVHLASSCKLKHRILRHGS